MKGKDLKDYWEGDLGVSYIPYNKLKEDMDLDALEDGGKFHLFVLMVLLMMILMVLTDLVYYGFCRSVFTWCPTGN